MLNSMTAYARKESQTEAGTLVWELRSVNHRYLEPSIRLPDGFREIDTELRSIMRSHVQRGKLECMLRYEPSSGQVQPIEVNLELVTELHGAMDRIARILDNPAHISALDILQFPGVWQRTEEDLESVQQDALTLFAEALEELCAMRAREGARILPMIESRIDGIRAQVRAVRDQLPTIMDRQADAIRARIADLQEQIDDHRIEQELVIMLQKADVAEELDRLESHLKEIGNNLVKNEPVGRRLDFLMQELNREANTLSSKSLASSTSQQAVEIKVLIEQMREQIQNIE
jgi:uncharacterized protein (TIGR00255 family)